MNLDMPRADKISVLICDDDDLVRETLVDALSSQDMHVIEARDGDECLQAMAQSACDVVVVDIVMPQREGLGTIIEIGKRYPFQKVVAISGGGRTKTNDYLQMAAVLGAHRTLTKPFEPQALIAAVRELAGT